MTEPAHHDGPDIEERLVGERALPNPGFRGELRQRLVALEESGYGRPPQLRALIAGYAVSGAALLIIGFAGVVGIGPLA